jgi:hypothetical protein
MRHLSQRVGHPQDPVQISVRDLAQVASHPTHGSPLIERRPIPSQEMEKLRGSLQAHLSMLTEVTRATQRQPEVSPAERIIESTDELPSFAAL